MPPNPMRLKNLTLSGYQGVSSAPGKELILENLGLRNLFIGQNNGGKSTVYRFLLTAIHSFMQGEGPKGAVPFPLIQAMPAELFDSNLFWQQNDQDDAWSVLTFTSPGPDFSQITFPQFQGGIIHNNEWRLTIRIQRNGDQGVFFACPQIWMESKKDWFDIVRRDLKHNRPLQYLDEHANYISPGQKHPQQLETPILQPARTLGQPLKEWASKSLFFDPFRSLRRGDSPQLPLNQLPNQDRQLVEDGSGVLSRIHKLFNDHNKALDSHKFKRHLLKRINRLFDHPFAEIDTKTTPSLDLSLRLNGDDAVPLPLQRMGGGIAQMVILLAALEKDALNSTDPHQYFLEEPELHLHPRLLRRFMTQLHEYKNAQFFITSHSNALLDTIGEEDRIYWFTQESGGNCVVRPANTVVEKHALLDALGVSGATLLQANCVIWVEGPSDRLYLRRWLSELATEKGKELIEGADYTFVFYGGKVLAHHSFHNQDPEDEDSEMKDLIQMLPVSRYSAVLMDRDRPPGETSNRLSSTKVKIIEAAQVDPTHRLACITNGREIENDLPAGAFKAGVASYLNIATDQLDALTVTGQSRYPDEIASHLGKNELEKEKLKKKLGGNKVDLALAILGGLESSGPPLLNCRVKSA